MLLFQKYWYLRFWLDLCLGTAFLFRQNIWSHFFFKKRSYQFRVRTDLDCGFEHRCSPHWTMDSFTFQHQEHSLSLPATFIIFLFLFFFLGEGWLCLILSMVASLEILKGNFYLQKTKARQSNSKTQELKSYQKVCSHSCILYKTAMHLLKVNPN